MKKLYTLVMLMACLSTGVFAQTIDELKAKKGEIAAAQAEAQAKADALKGEITGIQDQIDILSGWTKGFSGDVGFGLNKANNYASLPNPNASSAGIGFNIAAFANKMSEKTMFRNKLLTSVNWQDVDPASETIEDGLFDGENRTGDILNLSSLYGYRIHPKVALSALGELNTSLFQFLEPGVIDIGIGATWTPNNNLVVVVHPLNYNFAFTKGDGITDSSSSTLGAKVRADYGNDFIIAGKKFGVSSTLTGFMPYSGDKPLVNAEGENAGLFQYTWINKVSFTIWNGIGVGAGFSLRKADFETNQTQTIYNLGLSYTL